MAPPVTFRADRTCCDRDDPVRFQSDVSALKNSWEGIYVRSECCGQIHHADRVSSTADA